MRQTSSALARRPKSPAHAYRFTDQVRYLDAWFDALNLTRDVTLVVHDWGSALGFHRARRFPSQVRAIVHMEAIAMVRNWADFGPAADIFKELRAEKMIYPRILTVRRGTSKR